MRPRTPILHLPRTTRSVGLLVASALLAACDPNATTLDLRSPGPWRSAVVLRGPVVSPSAVAFDLTAPHRLEISAGELSDASVLVLYYALPPAALGLRPGPLDRAAVGARSHALPIPHAAQLLEAHDSAVLDATRTATGSALFRAFRIPDSGIDACLSQGGCYLRDVDHLCANPCPTREDVAAPTLPELPRFTCESWPRVRASVLGSSAPELDAFEACPIPAAGASSEGQASVPSRGCLEVRASCSAWAEGLPVDTIHVRAGASGGDGSRASPLGSIEDALVRAASRMSTASTPVLALAPGVFEVDLVLRAPVRIVGCASTVHGLVRVAEGTVELDSLQLAAGTRGALRVDAGASVELTHARVTSSTPTRTGMTIAGSATIAKGLVELGRDSIFVTPGGRLSLLETELRNDRAPLLHASGGRVRATDVAFSSSATASESMVELVDTEAWLTQTRLDLTGERLRTEGGECYELDGERNDPSALRLRGRSVGQLDRVTLSAGAHASLVRANDDARIEGSELVGLGGTALLEAQDRARLVVVDALATGMCAALIVNAPPSVELTRVLSIGAKWRAISIGNGGSLSLSDGTLVDSDFGLATWEKTTVTARRLQILGPLRRAIISKSPRAFFTDITIKQAREAGIQVFQDVLIPAPRASLSMERVSLSDGAGVGIWFSQKSDVLSRDVCVRRTGPATTQKCTVGSGIGEAPCTGEAVRVANDTVGRLERFVIREAARGIVYASRNFDLSSGLVETSETGLVVVDEDRVLEEFLDRVQVFGNESNVVLGFRE